MGNKSQFNKVDELINLSFSNAQEKANLEKERALYSKQVEKTHELNANLEGLAKKISLLEVKADKAKAAMENLFTVGLSEESKKMVRAQLNDIFGEKIAQLKKEADEEVKRVRKEGKRVSVPISVVSVIGVTLLVLIIAFVVLIVANAYHLHSSWLTKYIWSVIVSGVAYVALVVYLSYRSRRHFELRKW